VSFFIFDKVLFWVQVLNTNFPKKANFDLGA